MEPPTIRLLPEGGPRAVAGLKQLDTTIQVELNPESGEQAEFRRRTLVEIVTADRIFMGPVLNRTEMTLSVDIEHVLDRERLRAMQAIWGLDAD